MAVKIGHASIDENKKISGGKVGDQTGKEICIRDWYKKPWDVMLICIDAKIADKAADYMEAICKNDNYGYDQSQRTTGYESIKKNGVAKGKGEFDCSSLVASCYKLAGLNINVNCTTRNLRAALLATKKFKAYEDNAHVNTSEYAQRGAIYLSEGHHVVMALGSGSKASMPETDNKSKSDNKSKTDNKAKIGKYKVTADLLNVRLGPGTENKIVKVIKKDQVVNITKIDNGWGKYSAGWISLKYAKKV